MSTFASQMNPSHRADGGNYLTEAAEYLAARGLTIDDLPIIPYTCIPMGWYTREKAGLFAPFTPEGWAYDLGDGAFQMRVCNYPEKSLYEERNGVKKRMEVDPPKFLTSGSTLMWVSTHQELANAPLIMLHEKATSAVLCRNLLGIPSLAFMGCWGWSADGKMKPEVRRVVQSLQHGAKVAVMFDRDMSNPLKNIKDSAAKLTYLIGQMREDVEVVALEVPGNDKDGWDDWIVREGPAAAAEALRELLASPGVTLRMPPEFWIEQFGLSYVMKKTGPLIEAKLQNFCKLLTSPPWTGIFRDINGGYFDENLNRVAEGIDDLYVQVACWMDENLWAGTGVAVSKEGVKDAIRRVMNANQKCAALERIKSWPEVTEEQARQAAYSFATDAIRVKGPYPIDQSVEVLLRVFRDLCYLWDGKDAKHVQWVLALVGPQGCGKSSLFENILHPLEVGGYKPSLGPVPLDEDKAIKIARDCLVGMFDDWHHMDRASATKAENVIYKLSTQAANLRANAKYMEDSQECPRHAALVLTTTPHNTQFLQSAKGTGERRFICLNVEGTVEGPMGYGGKRLMVPNWELIHELSPILLRYGYQTMMAGDKAPANEWSLEHVSKFQAREWAVDIMDEAYPTPDKCVESVESVLRAWGWDGEGEECRVPMAVLIKTMHGAHRCALGVKLRQSYRQVVEGLGASIHDGQMKCRVPGKGKPEARRDVVMIESIEGFCKGLLDLF